MTSNPSKTRYIRAAGNLSKDIWSQLPGPSSITAGAGPVFVLAKGHQGIWAKTLQTGGGGAQAQVSNLVEVEHQETKKDSSSK